MKKWLKRLGIAISSFLILAFLALEVVKRVGLAKGVEIVNIPPYSEIYKLERSSNYKDAYRLQVKDGATIDQVTSLSQAMKLGKLVHKDDHEIVYKGGAPGLEYHASFFLEKSNTSTFLTFSTVVHYNGTAGVIYFTPVKQIHKRGLPLYLLKQFEEILP